MKRQESGIAAEAEVTAHYGDHPIERGKGNMIWTGTVKDTGIEIEIEGMILKMKGLETGNGSVRRVEVEKGMTMRGTKAERETEIGGDE